MSKPSESKRRRRAARKFAGWHPLAEWYRATNKAIIPADTVANHQYSRLNSTADARTPDPANPLPRATQIHNVLGRNKGVYTRGIITLPDDVMRRFVEQAGGSDHLAKALDEATKRCKNVVKLGE
jgi:hypothetical protein